MKRVFCDRCGNESDLGGGVFNIFPIQKDYKGLHLSLSACLSGNKAGDICSGCRQDAENIIRAWFPSES